MHHVELYISVIFERFNIKDTHEAIYITVHVVHLFKILENSEFASEFQEDVEEMLILIAISTNKG